MFRANERSRHAARGFGLACLLASVSLSLAGCSKPPPQIGRAHV